MSAKLQSLITELYVITHWKLKCTKTGSCGRKLQHLWGIGLLKCKILHTFIEMLTEILPLFGMLVLQIKEWHYRKCKVWLNEFWAGSDTNVKFKHSEKLWHDISSKNVFWVRTSHLSEKAREGCQKQTQTERRGKPAEFCWNQRLWKTHSKSGRHHVLSCWTCQCFENPSLWRREVISAELSANTGPRTDIPWSLSSSTQKVSLQLHPDFL